MRQLRATRSMVGCACGSMPISRRGAQSSTAGPRASSLQTGVYSGPFGSTLGQVDFRDGLVVREEQGSIALYTPRYGIFEVRCRAIDDPANMVALWMIGFGDERTNSAEICVCEIFGRDVGAATARVGMGVHPFGDPSIRDEFGAEPVAIDARETHTYSVRWTSTEVAFYVDDAAGQGRRAVAGLSDAVHARHLRVLRRTRPAVACRPLPEGLRGRVVPRLPAGRWAGREAAGVPPLISSRAPELRARSASWPRSRLSAESGERRPRRCARRRPLRRVDPRQRPRPGRRRSSLRMPSASRRSSQPRLIAARRRFAGRSNRTAQPSSSWTPWGQGSPRHGRKTVSRSPLGGWTRTLTAVTPARRPAIPARNQIMTGFYSRSPRNRIEPASAGSLRNPPS